MRDVSVIDVDYYPIATDPSDLSRAIYWPVKIGDFTGYMSPHLLAALYPNHFRPRLPLSKPSVVFQNHHFPGGFRELKMMGSSRRCKSNFPDLLYTADHQAISVYKVLCVNEFDKMILTRHLRGMGLNHLSAQSFEYIRTEFRNDRDFLQTFYIPDPQINSVTWSSKIRHSS